MIKKILNVLEKFTPEIAFTVAWAFMAALLLSSCSPRLPDAVAQVRDSVVMVEATTELLVTTISWDGRGLVVGKSTATVVFQGTGVLITKNGHVLTAGHLFDEGVLKRLEVTTTNGRKYVAETLGVDHGRDLALIKVSTDAVFKPALFARLGGQRVGDQAFAIGYPLGLPLTVTHGIISSLGALPGRSVSMTGTDVFLNHGNSGGPVYDIEGRMIGIVSGFFADSDGFTGLGCIVSLEEINNFLSKYRGL